MKLIPVNCLDGTRTFETNLPNNCPHCGKIMTPDTLGKGVSQSSTSDTLIRFGLLVRCTSRGCRKYYALEFSYNTLKRQNSLISYSYRPPIESDLPENIENISPSFVEIYTQATKAEEEGLSQISGVGYRKSLEFLIKDYVIFLNPDLEENVKKAFLGKVIEKHLSHLPRLQNLAKAATWIGNDETHYVRRHDNKDIRDMKQFIKSTAHFVVADYDASVAEQFITSDD